MRAGGQQTHSVVIVSIVVILIAATVIAVIAVVVLVDRSRVRSVRTALLGLLAPARARLLSIRAPLRRFLAPITRLFDRVGMDDAADPLGAITLARAHRFVSGRNLHHHRRTHVGQRTRTAEDRSGHESDASGADHRDERRLHPRVHTVRVPGGDQSNVNSA